MHSPISIFDELSKRINNPIFSSFFLSFAAWNWPFFIALIFGPDRIKTAQAIKCNWTLGNWGWPLLIGLGLYGLGYGARELHGWLEMLFTNRWKKKDAWNESNIKMMIINNKKSIKHFFKDIYKSNHDDLRIPLNQHISLIKGLAVTPPVPAHNWTAFTDMLIESADKVSSSYGRHCDQLNKISSY